MNIKQKMIEAGQEAARAYLDRWLESHGVIDGDEAYNRAFAVGIDAALAVLADPENWTDEMDMKARRGNPILSGPFLKAAFADVINHVREQKG